MSCQRKFQSSQETIPILTDFQENVPKNEENIRVQQP